MEPTMPRTRTMKQPAWLQPINELPEDLKYANAPITPAHAITAEQVADTLTQLLEGDTYSYWGSIDWRTMRACQPNWQRMTLADLLLATLARRSVIVYDQEERAQLGMISAAGIEAAELKMLRSGIAGHTAAYARILAGAGDALDADTWLQYVVMGEARFG
jgi:hypothetical protein